MIPDLSEPDEKTIEMLYAKASDLKEVIEILKSKE